MDRLALEFIRMPVVQLGIKGQCSDHNFGSSPANQIVESSQPFSVPALFRSLALRSTNAPGHPIRFYSEEYGPRPVVSCLPEGSLGSTTILTCEGDDRRARFLLQLIQPLLDTETDKQTWFIESLVDITDAVRECAIDFASKPKDNPTDAKLHRERRNAVTESQMCSEAFEWLELARKQSIKWDEGEQAVSVSPSSASSSSSSASWSTVGSSQSASSASSILLTNSFRGAQLSSALPVADTASAQPTIALLNLVKEIGDHHRNYFLLAPPTLPLRSRPNPNYDFTEHQITHVSCSLQIDKRFPPSLISPALSGFSRPSIDEVIFPRARSTSSAQAPRGLRRKHTINPSMVSQCAPIPNPYSPLSSTSPFVLPSLDHHGHGFTTPTSPGPHSPLNRSAKAPSPLTPARIFQYTAPSTLASISASMAAGKPFRAYAMYSSPQRLPSSPTSAKSPGLPTYSLHPLDEERSTGKWLYGVAMGDGREGVIGCWMCWLLDPEIEKDVMEA